MRLCANFPSLPIWNVYVPGGRLVFDGVIEYSFSTTVKGVPDAADEELDAAEEDAAEEDDLMLLALDGNRLLVVEEWADRVSAINLTTGAVTPVIQGLDLGARVVPTALPYGIFNGITDPFAVLRPPR